jgi:serine/threonine protein kinase
LARKKKGVDKRREIYVEIADPDYDESEAPQEDESNSSRTENESDDGARHSAGASFDTTALRHILTKFSKAERLGRRVLKLCTKSDVVVIKWNDRASWQRESSILQQLSHVKGVVQPLESWEADGVGYLTFAYLKDEIVPPTAFFDFAEKLLQVVSSLHQMTLCHGDIKRGNIIWTASGDLFLIDYDLAGNRLFCDGTGTGLFCCLTREATIALRKSCLALAYLRTTLETCLLSVLRFTNWCTISSSQPGHGCSTASTRARLGPVAQVCCRG